MRSGRYTLFRYAFSKTRPYIGMNRRGNKRGRTRAVHERERAYSELWWKVAIRTRTRRAQGSTPFSRPLDQPLLSCITCPADSRPAVRREAAASSCGAPVLIASGYIRGPSPVPPNCFTGSFGSTGARDRSPHVGRSAACGPDGRRRRLRAQQNYSRSNS